MRHRQDRHTVDAVGGEVVQGGVRPVEGVRRDRGADAVLGGRGEEFAAVLAGVGGDAADGAFPEEVPLVVE
ncbi:hypothetical protein [Streptomyces rhizosphaericus]|uniref:hypothetical protein n=1 Tax=Streptomyces rhizosphaericus TaxID=114699 RepID=UPI003630DB2A